MKSIFRYITLISLTATVFICSGWGIPKMPQTGSSESLEKYDQFFNKVDSIQGEIQQVEGLLNSFPSDIAQILKEAQEAVGAVPKDSSDIKTIVSDLIRTYKSSGLKLKVDLDSEKVFKVVSSVGDADLEMVKKSQLCMDEASLLVSKLKAIPQELEEPVNVASAALNDGQSLIQSAPSDFFGKNAMKLPGITKKLNKSVSSLSEVPETVESLISSSTDTINQFCKAFDSV